MDQRLNLHNLLLSLAPQGWKVYYTPPATLSYPCIKYSWTGEYVRYGSNNKYIKRKVWQIVVIDKTHKSTVPDSISNLEYCRFVRTFTTDGLVHTIYELHF